MSPLATVLRRPSASDAEALAAFSSRIFPLGGRPGADPADLDAFISTELTPARFRTWAADPNALLQISEYAGRIAGFAMLLRQQRHPLIAKEDIAELRKLYVDPAFHGSGVADHLTRELLQEAAERPVWLSVFSENPRAIRFYQRWGFVVVGEQDFIVGKDHQKDFLMLRERKQTQ